MYETMSVVKEYDKDKSLFQVNYHKNMTKLKDYYIFLMKHFSHHVYAYSNKFVFFSGWGGNI